MSRKKSRMYVVKQEQEKRSLSIDMNDLNIKKAYHPVTFKTGRHVTEKDRPRKKNWMKEADSSYLL